MSKSPTLIIRRNVRGVKCPDPATFEHINPIAYNGDGISFQSVIGLRVAHDVHDSYWPVSCRPRRTSVTAGNYISCWNDSNITVLRGYDQPLLFIYQIDWSAMVWQQSAVLHLVIKLLHVHCVSEKTLRSYFNYNNSVENKFSFAAENQLIC